MAKTDALTALMGENLALNAASDLDRVLGTTRETSKFFEQMTALNNAVCPPAMRSILDIQEKLGRFANPLGSFAELQRTVDRFADPFGLSKLAQVDRFSAVHRMSSEGFGLSDSMRALTEAFHVSDSMRAVTSAFQNQRDLLGISKLHDLGLGLEAVVGRSAMRDCLAPFMKLDRSLGSVLESSSYGRWQSDFAQTVMPSLGLLGMEWQRPIGVLASFGDADLGASMSWMSSNEIAGVAAMLPHVETRSEITIEVSITCAFCGHDMIADKRRFRWKGNRKGLLDLSIVPICTECQHRSNEDPTYLSRALRELEAPTLRVVTSNGTSDGVPRGKLRLVQDERDREDD